MFKELIKNEASVAQGVTSLIKENNQNGYFTKSEFVTRLDEWSSDQKTHYKVRNLQTLFKAMKQNVSLTREPQHVVEEGISYTWLKMKVGRIEKPMKIEHFGEMKRFIDDYAMGVVKVTQTLEELYDEASA